MSFGASLFTQAISAVNGVGEKSPVGSSGGGLNPLQNEKISNAFQSQLKIAQGLFGGGEKEEGMGGIESSLLNSAMATDNLGALKQLFNGKNLPGQALQSAQNPAIANAAPNISASATSQMPAENPYMAAMRRLNPEAVLASGVNAPSSTPTATLQAVAKTHQPVKAQFDLGKLSEKFESNGDIGLIGYDRVGGTSYGNFQIASRPGTMDEFLKFLDEKAPDLASRLRQSGPSNTGSKHGEMPNEWRSIASEQPGRFGDLQKDFVTREHYEPAKKMVSQLTGFNLDLMPKALQEVLWSTSVQHGPTGAASIFDKVIKSNIGKVRGADLGRKLIEGVYESRKEQFGSSSFGVQSYVKNRLESEKDMALSMLGDGMKSLRKTV